MHIRYFLTDRNLPAAIITHGKTLDFHPMLDTIASYEVEVDRGKLHSTGYIRSRDEVAMWREVSRDVVERREMHLALCFLGTVPKFWTTYVEAMATEIVERLRDKRLAEQQQQTEQGNMLDHPHTQKSA